MSLSRVRNVIAVVAMLVVVGVLPASAATWGASYAISEHPDFLLNYHGKARARGNVYNGMRIIQVCIKYTRGTELLEGPVCSNARKNSNGTWSVGPEVRMHTTDSWDPTDLSPKTVFSYTRKLIHPGD